VRDERSAQPYLKVEGLVLRKRGGSSSLLGRIEEPCKPWPFAALEAESGQRSSTLMRTSRVFACLRWQRFDNVCLGSRPSNVLTARGAGVWPAGSADVLLRAGGVDLGAGGAVAAELHSRRYPRETCDSDQSLEPRSCSPLMHERPERQRGRPLVRPERASLARLRRRSPSREGTSSARFWSPPPRRTGTYAASALGSSRRDLISSLP
jgi:hypothetical protein